MGTCLHKRTVSGARRGPQTLGPTASEPTRIGTGTLNGARSGHHPTRVTTRTAGPQLHRSRRSVSALPSTLLGRLAAAAFSGLLNLFAVWLWIYAISDLGHANAHSALMHRSRKCKRLWGTMEMWRRSSTSTPTLSCGSQRGDGPMRSLHAKTMRFSKSVPRPRLMHSKLCMVHGL
jgi:hypothetical protein